jgi:hypothetical protein
VAQGPRYRSPITGDGWGWQMQDIARFSASTIKCVVLTLAVLGAKAACATPAIQPPSQPKMDCKQYDVQQRANLDALKQADPAISDASLDSVFYSVNRNACLASVIFTKGVDTYSGIFDISAGRMLWAKSYRGTSFTPVNIVEMDETMDEKAKELEFAPIGGGTSRPSDFFPDLLDRTKSTLPAIRNVLMLVR